ncbi:PKD domain-containing protein [Pararcticibacter amylolyticus]|uniref:PKD domain-containing protein n=1 Tax=Pararcticibacter amylolyticus TaxID=2173175 RepID=A0A2U2PEN7_9SPHI|nr:PKD domain-containing protein [Pararcticibacter amylolyticus]PWG79792.1 hypothetical protein DDR33_15385 [Pararcticibacter amylolyticus]
MKRKIVIMPCIALAMLCIFSCKKDEKGSGLKAVFSYVADGFVVNFTDFSQNAGDYKWDFGDGSEGSTRSNPSHIYSKKGGYMVSLEITNNGETSTFKDSVYVLGPNIKIDGDFNDWEHVEYSYTNENGGGTLLKVKTFASTTDVNFYLEGNQSFNLAVFDLYIDSDNNPNTGLKTWLYPVTAGADFLFEGNFNPANPAASTGSVFAHNAPDNGWGWNEVASFANAMKFAKMGTLNGNKVIEFSVKKSVLGSPKKYLNFALVEMDTGWTEIGSLPASQKATSGFTRVEL